VELISSGENLVSFNAAASAGRPSARGALIVVQLDGRICFAGAQARSWLVRYFGTPRATHLLPEALIRWLRANIDRSTIYAVADRGLQLNVQMLEMDGSGAICLLLAEQTIEGFALPSALQGLTPREAEVLALLSGGRSNAEIAQMMQLAIHTVKKHLQNIYIKLHVKSRTAALSMFHGPQTLAMPLREKGGHGPQERKFVLQLPSSSGRSGPERPAGRRFAA
jgi:DNA-binding CsgD family transcriptional regulator